MIGNDVKNNKRLPSNFWNPSGLLGYSMQNITVSPITTYVKPSFDMKPIPKIESAQNKIRMLTSGDMVQKSDIFRNRTPDYSLANKININFGKMGVSSDIGLPIKESIKNTTEPYWILGAHTVNTGPKSYEYQGGKFNEKSPVVSWDSLKTWIDQNPNIKKAFFPGCNTGESCKSLSKLPPSDKFYFPKYKGSSATSLYNLGGDMTLPLNVEKASLISGLMDDKVDPMYQKESELQLSPGENNFQRFNLARFNKVTPNNSTADSLMNLLVNKLADKKIINKRTYKPTNEEWDY